MQLAEGRVQLKEREVTTETSYDLGREGFIRERGFE